MKKIIAFCLSVVISMIALSSTVSADSFERIPSVIPGTETKYNYIEQITIQFPGTDETVELTNVAEQVGIGYYDNGEIAYYCFDLYEESSTMTINESGTWLVGSYGPTSGGASAMPVPAGTVISNTGYVSYDKSFYENNDEYADVIYSVEFRFGQGTHYHYEFEDVINISELAVEDEEIPKMSLIMRIITFILKLFGLR